jgi:hypothetical protein
MAAWDYQLQLGVDNVAFHQFSEGLVGPRLHAVADTGHVFEVL